jgi:chromosome segregation ATPase
MRRETNCRTVHKSLLAPVALFLLCCWLSPGALRAQDVPQTAPAATLPPSPVQNPTETDTFRAIREAADAKRNVYEELDTKSMAEIDRLMHTKRCQINRIGPLLDNNIKAMQDWLSAERKYWELWGETEQKRVDSQMDTLARMEGDQKRVADLLDTEKTDHLELLRRKSELEQARRTEAIAAQIDALIKDIQDSESRLTDAQQQFDSLTTQIKNMKASISTRLVGIRQNTARLDAWQLDMTAYYEKARAAANEMCNLMTPVTGQTPLPKKGGN